MFSYNIVDGELEAGEAQAIVDLSGTPATPDGGAMTEGGNIWNSQWDGARVVCYSSKGEQLDRLELGIPRPTSCCFGGPDFRHLFITSAREGISEQELSRQPLSGSVFVIELQEAGQPLTPFTMK